MLALKCGCVDMRPATSVFYQPLFSSTQPSPSKIPGNLKSLQFPTKYYIQGKILW